MKMFQLSVVFFASIGWLSGPVIADELPPKQITLPENVRSLAPADMTPIFYSSDGPDAVMVLESKNRNSDDHLPIPKARLLILFRKDGSRYKEVERSEKIFACSTCGNDGLDPFVSEGILLRKGRLLIEQDYSAEPSTAVYKFSYNPKLLQWVVLSVVNTDVFQNFGGGNLIQEPHRIQIKSPLLLKSFDPGWQPRVPGIAVTIDEIPEIFSFSYADTTAKLDADVVIECSKKPSCHEIGRQMIGCISLTKNNKSKLFIGTSNNRRKPWREGSRK